MTKETQEQLVASAFDFYTRKFGEVSSSTISLCVAVAFINVAQRAGCDWFTLQAGSTFFKHRKEDVELFGYEFKEAEALLDIQRDVTPAMHVWVLDAEDAEAPQIVDLSLGYQFKFAKELGITWEPSLILPKYFWGTPDKESMIYIPDEFATKLAYLLGVGICN